MLGFSLARVTPRRGDTSGTAIGIALLVVNLEMVLQITLRLSAGPWRWAVFLPLFVVPEPQAGSAPVA